MTKRGRPARALVYDRVTQAIAELRERLGGLPSPTEADEIWKDIWHQEVHNSTAIEGNTLVQKQVAALLEEGKAIGSKELREYMEVRGYADAARWVYEQAIEPGGWSDGRLVTLTEVREVHRMALQPVWDVAPHADATPREGPGSFREHEIKRFPGSMKPASWPDVPALMRDWVNDSAKIRTAVHSIQTIAELHGRFQRIHPFLDGNGRVGRLLANLFLVRRGYAPAIIYKRDRDRYINALRRSDSGDAGLLGELYARAVLDNLYRFIVPAVAGPTRLVPLAALSNKKISANALRVAAIRGRLKAHRGGDGQWRSTKNWVDAYLAARYSRE